MTSRENKQIKEAELKATEQIIKEMNIDGVIDNLLSLPANICSQEKVLAMFKRKLDDAKSELDLAKQVIVAVVISETNEDGKPRYTNEKAREAEIAKRMNVGSEYQKVLKKVREAEEEVNSEQFEMNCLLNEFSAYRAVAKILAGKLQLMAGL